MRFEVGYATDIGPNRSSNQDAVGIRGSAFHREDIPPLFVVADGMGGMQGGDIASTTAVETMLAYFRENKIDLNEPADELINAVVAANDTIYEMAQERDDITKMGTTIVAASMSDTALYIANVGDSRAYLIRQESIEQITRDNSMAEELKRMGIGTGDHFKHMLTRSVGTHEELDIDVYYVHWEIGDMLLLCSDGLWGVLTEDDLRTTVASMTAQEAAESLVAQAIQNETKDNITALIVSKVV